MKRIIFMRHAKASQAKFHQNDHERNLSETGINEAKTIAKFILSKGVFPDIMLISDAKRTQETWTYLNDVIQNKRSKFDRELYLASSKTIVKKLKEIDNILDSALVLAHNPGITDVLNEYFKVNLDHMSTCGVCCIWFHTDKFENILDCETELAYFSYPSKINNG